MSFIFESDNGLAPSYNELYAKNMNDCNSNCIQGRQCYRPNKSMPWMKRGVCANDTHTEYSKYTPYTYDPQWEETYFNAPCQGPARVNGLWFQHVVKPFQQCRKGCKCKKCL